MDLPEPFEWAGKEQIRHALDHYDKPCLFYFVDPNGSLCQLINPSVQRVSKNHDHKFEFVAININENRDITYELKIMRSPSFMILRKGSEIRRLTDVDYSNEFEEEFEEFLVGDFLLQNEDFDYLTDMNYFEAIDDWFGHNVVAFLKPSDPINWEIADVLEDLQDEFPSEVRVRVIDINDNDELPSFYGIENFPAVLAIKDGKVKKEWSPVSNPQQIQQDFQDLVDSKVS